MRWRESRCSICRSRISKFSARCPHDGHPNTWNQKAGIITQVFLYFTIVFQLFDMTVNNVLFPIPLILLAIAILMRLTLRFLRWWYPDAPF